MYQEGERKKVIYSQFCPPTFNLLHDSLFRMLYNITLLKSQMEYYYATEKDIAVVSVGNMDVYVCVLFIKFHIFPVKKSHGCCALFHSVCMARRRDGLNY